VIERKGFGEMSQPLWKDVSWTTLDRFLLLNAPGRKLLAADIIFDEI
jgi:hypothetical protein